MNKLIPFGKYKDKPIEFLANDKDYIKWLLSTDWFKDKYNNIYNIVINNFHEPSESPEHNKLQIKFLDSDHRLKFAYAALGEELFSCSIDRIDELFSQIFSGLWQFYSAKYSKNIETLKHSINYNENSIRDYPGTPRAELAKENLLKNRQELDIFTKEDIFIESEIRSLLLKYDNCTFKYIKYYNVDFENTKTSSDVSFSIQVGVVDSYDFLESIRKSINPHGRLSEFFRFSVELKPVVYDDFPAILRQMKHSGATYLLIGEYRGVGATLEEFIDYFKTQGIMVLFEGQVINTSVPHHPDEYIFKLNNFLDTKPSGDKYEWNIKNEGRRWSVAEQTIKMRLIPEQLFCVNGKIFESEDHRSLLMKMLLENIGKDKILEIIK